MQLTKLEQERGFFPQESVAGRWAWLDFLREVNPSIVQGCGPRGSTGILSHVCVVSIFVVMFFVHCGHAGLRWVVVTLNKTTQGGTCAESNLSRNFKFRAGIARASCVRMLLVLAHQSMVTRAWKWTCDNRALEHQFRMANQ